MNKYKKIDALVNRYQHGDTTPEEDKLIESILFKENESVPESDQEKVYKTHLWTRLAPTLSLPKKRKYNWYYAAASILIISMVSCLLLKYKTKDKLTNEIVFTTDQKDISPGTNKATLTLADGTKVELDDKQEGIIINDTTIRYKRDNNSTIVHSNFEEQSAHLELQTPKGGQYQITLADGTRVWLNAASTLRYPNKFTGDSREVYLEGEAYFEVNESISSSQSINTNDQITKKPFIVKSAHQQTLVLGTKFNINTYEPLVKTTLAKGRIQVTNQVGKTIILAPNEQAISSTSSLIKENIILSNELAWKAGKFSFDNKSFSQIMEELARWYDLDIVYQNGIPKEELTGDAFRNQNLKLVLRILDAVSISYKIDIESRKLIIIGKTL